MPTMDVDYANSDKLLFCVHLTCGYYQHPFSFPFSLHSNNKATSDPSRKFLVSCKEKLKQSEENRSSGWKITCFPKHTFPKVLSDSWPWNMK